VVSPGRFTPGEKPPVPIGWLDGPESRSEHCGEGKYILPLPEIEPRASSQQTVAILTELSRLQIFKEEEETKLRGRSPQANYTDRATAACQRS
jgi:hypothetical protein